jgi:hypothetical protein
MSEIKPGDFPSMNRSAYLREMIWGAYQTREVALGLGEIVGVGKNDGLGALRTTN